MLGCKQKEMGSYISWARLAAASGLVAITYTTRDPASDVDDLLRYVRENASALGIAENRLGVWACSGNVPNALSVLTKEGAEHLRCAVMCYGYMPDFERGAVTAEAAMKWGFVNPGADKIFTALPQQMPLFIVRAGQDEMPRLNETIDHFVGQALSHNLPITLVNHAAAPHAFDLFHDSETSREIIRQILTFMQVHLLQIPDGS
jgi:acetyl esterase/lipase